MESRQDDIASAKSWLPGFLRNKSQDKGSNGSDTPPDESTILLPKPSDEEPTEGTVYDLEDGDKKPFQLVLAEFWLLLKGSVPVILAYTLQNSLQTISVLVVGRLSPEALATAAFSYMFAMATAWLIGTFFCAGSWQRAIADNFQHWEEPPQSTRWLAQALREARTRLT